MKKKLIALVGILTGAFLFVFMFGFKTYAEELPQENQEPTSEVVEQEQPQEEQQENVVVIQQEEVFTEEEKSKINKAVDFIQSLSKEELLGLLNEVKGWLISIGIVGGTSFLAALLGLIAAIVKLRNEKIRNSQLTEAAKQEKIDESKRVQDALESKTNEIKNLMLEFMNGLDDTEKKKVENNVASIKAKLYETVETKE